MAYCRKPLTESVPKSHDWPRTLKLRSGKREAAEYISIFFYCPTLAEVIRAVRIQLLVCVRVPSITAATSGQKL